MPLILTECTPVGLLRPYVPCRERWHVKCLKGYITVTVLESIMIGVIIFLALLFGGIAIWAGIRLIKMLTASERRGRGRASLRRRRPIGEARG